jgi:hypothetical protein
MPLKNPDSAIEVFCLKDLPADMEAKGFFQDEKALPEESVMPLPNRSR